MIILLILKEKQRNYARKEITHFQFRYILHLFVYFCMCFLVKRPITFLLYIFAHDLGKTCLQLEGISKELASLRALLSYIEIYKHEAPYLPEILEKIIAELERQQTKKMCEYDDSNDKNGLLTGSKATSLQQHSELKCVAPTNKITASAASTINSVNTPESEPQEQSDNKRQKTEVPKEVPPIDSVGVASAFHSTQPPSWQRPVLFMDQRSPHLNTSAGHYSLSGHPPASLHMNSYNSPNYPEGAIREPVYYDRPPPLGRPGVAIRGPGLYNWPMPHGGCNLPP